jgi:cytoskeletal protein CcmA (bactofilin family)
MAPNRHEDLTINTIIGPGTVFRGDIDAAGFVRVDGELHGDVSAQGRVVVGERARMRSNIVGTSVVVGGVVKGDIYASERVTVLSTGLVLGDIITRRLQADEGNLIHGQVVACGDQADWQSRLDAYRDGREVRRRSAGKAAPQPALIDG